jgi:zinc finger CCHC domain-containing protein 8
MFPQVAKAELAKVKQARQFQLETINIQDKGQGKWRKKYVYWIPALHIDGKEVVKGRWDATHVNQALDLWEKEQQKTDGGA